MFLRWVTAAYLVYLVVPIALLLVGSFGELWVKTLLPTGSTTQCIGDRAGGRVVAEPAAAARIHDAVVRRRRQGPELPPRVRREPRGRRDHLHGVRGNRGAARLRALPHRSE